MAKGGGDDGRRRDRSGKKPARRTASGGSSFSSSSGGGGGKKARTDGKSGKSGKKTSPTPPTHPKRGGAGKKAPPPKSRHHVAKPPRRHAVQERSTATALRRRRKKAADAGDSPPSGRPRRKAAHAGGGASTGRGGWSCRAGFVEDGGRGGRGGGKKWGAPRKRGQFRMHLPNANDRAFLRWKDVPWFRTPGGGDGGYRDNDDSGDDDPSSERRDGSSDDDDVEGSGDENEAIRTGNEGGSSLPLLPPERILAQIDGELVAFGAYVGLASVEARAREAFVDHVSELAAAQFAASAASRRGDRRRGGAAAASDGDGEGSGVRVAPFGSFATREVCTFASDVDMCLWGAVEGGTMPACVVGTDADAFVGEEGEGDGDGDGDGEGEGDGRDEALVLGETSPCPLLTESSLLRAMDAISHAAAAAPAGAAAPAPAMDMPSQAKKPAANDEHAGAPGQSAGEDAAGDGLFFIDRVGVGVKEDAEEKKGDVVDLSIDEPTAEDSKTDPPAKEFDDVKDDEAAPVGAEMIQVEEAAQRENDKAKGVAKVHNQMGDFEFALDAAGIRELGGAAEDEAGHDEPVTAPALADEADAEVAEEDAAANEFAALVDEADDDDDGDGDGDDNDRLEEGGTAAVPTGETNPGRADAGRTQEDDPKAVKPKGEVDDRRPGTTEKEVIVIDDDDEAANESAALADESDSDDRPEEGGAAASGPAAASGTKVDDRGLGALEKEVIVIDDDDNDSADKMSAYYARKTSAPKRTSPTVEGLVIDADAAAPAGTVVLHVKQSLKKWPKLQKFFENLLGLRMMKVKQIGCGAIACQLVEYVFPGSLSLSEVNWAARTVMEKQRNHELLQLALAKHNVRWITSTGKKKMSEQTRKVLRGGKGSCLEFCRCLKGLYNRVAPTLGEQRKGYDPVAARGGASLRTDLVEVDDDDRVAPAVEEEKVPTLSLISRQPVVQKQKAGPTGKVRARVLAVLQGLTRQLRRSSFTHTIECRSRARVPIVNCATRTGFEGDIAVGGHNGVDTSTYAMDQVGRFNRWVVGWGGDDLAACTFACLLAALSLTMPAFRVMTALQRQYCS